MSSAGDETASSLQPSDLVVIPQATGDELAAIIAAYGELWPRDADAPRPVSSPRWRYVGRPWVRRSQYGGWR